MSRRRRAGHGVLIDPEPMLPTRGYRVLRHDATLIDLEADMWPMGRATKAFSWASSSAARSTTSRDCQTRQWWQRK
jgi:hypothetical protein